MALTLENFVITEARRLGFDPSAGERLELVRRLRRADFQEVTPDSQRAAAIIVADAIGGWQREARALVAGLDRLGVKAPSVALRVAGVEVTAAGKSTGPKIEAERNGKACPKCKQAMYAIALAGGAAANYCATDRITDIPEGPQ